MGSAIVHRGLCPKVMSLTITQSDLLMTRNGLEGIQRKQQR